MAKIELKPHQQEVLDLNPERVLVPDGTGTGKTIIGIYLADKNCKTCLVVTIKDNVKKWEREVQEFSNKRCKFTVISKENFKKLSPTLGKFDGVIWDECHFIGSIKSQISKAFRAWLKQHDIKYRWLMSATPVTANWLSVYVLACHLGHKLNYYGFMRFFFYEINMGGRRVWKQNPAKEELLMELVRKLAYWRMITMQDIAHVPEQKFNTVYFDLTKEQKEAIENIEDMQHIVRWTKTHQIENGVLKGNEYEPSKTFECAKDETIKNICQTTAKVAIFARYNDQLKKYKDLLSDFNRPIFIINGESKDRDHVVQEIEKAKSCIVLINSSCGTGYELPSIDTIIFASLSFSYIDYKQSLGRFLRISNLKKNYYYHLVIKGGIDEAVYGCIESKQSFYVDLYKK